MNNRNRDHEQRERTPGNRYSTSGYDSDEGDYGPGQYAASGRKDESSGSQRGAQSQWRSGRDVQGDSASWQQDRDSRQRHGREGSYPQSQSPDDAARRGEFGSRSQYGQGAPSRGPQAQSRDWQEPGSQRYDVQGSPYGSQGYGSGSDRYESQDFSQEYSQGSSHYGSQGFGAQGSQGVYGPQGLGAQGARGSSDYERQSGYGGYSREGYGARSQGGRSGQWRASDVTGQGYESQSRLGSYDRDVQGAGPGSSGSRYSPTGYRGLGPKNYTRSDERIREDLNEKLTDSDEIDASGISVEVSNGVATLSGTVEQRWMKHRAEDLAESCGGVRDVNNQIRVASRSASQGMSSESALGAGTSGSPGSLPSSTAAASSSAMNAGASGSNVSQAGSSSAAKTSASTGIGPGSAGTSGRSGGSTTPHNN